MILTLAIPLLTILIDRITKGWALSVACQAPFSLVGDYASCIITYNRGVSWSLLSSDTTGGFLLVTALILTVIGALVWHIIKTYQQQRWLLGELLVLGGALSNLYDRFVYGGVLDFIALHYGSWHFPIFNCADIAIVCGVLIMCYDAALRH